MKALFYLAVLFSSQVTFAQLSHLGTIEDETLLILTGKKATAAGAFIVERGSNANRKLTQEYLKESLKKLGYTPLENRYAPSTEGTNIYAELKATVAGADTVLIGAHFDSVGNAGANDNASGVAIVMAMAEKLKALPTRTKNVLFVFFDQEENGLVGSKHFANKLKMENTNIHSVHTIDQMGWDNDGDLAIELEKAPQDLYDFYSRVNKERGFNITLHQTNVTSTDHQSFRAQGFKSMGLTEEYRNNDTTNCYHSSCDTYETINFVYLMNTSRFWEAVIGALITLPPMSLSH